VKFLFNVWCEYYFKGTYYRKMIVEGSFLIDQLGKIMHYDELMNFDSNADKRFERILVLPFINMNDCKEKPLFVGDIVEGFGSRFLIKFGITKIKKVAPDSTINIVDCPSYFFESLQGSIVYPIVHNCYGEHDLERLTKIGNIFEDPELWDGKYSIVQIEGRWELV
jgi:hypothetical protein